MARTHSYEVTVTWTGDRGEGTRSYRAYGRDHEVTAAGKPPIFASSGLRSAPARYSPEDLFVASIAQCHMLWYLHLCVDAGVIVTGYIDSAAGTLTETPDGSGSFSEVLLRPCVTVAEADMVSTATAMHDKAHHMCFIAHTRSTSPSAANLPSMERPDSRYRRGAAHGTVRNVVGSAESRAARDRGDDPGRAAVPGAPAGLRRAAYLHDLPKLLA